jgi:hypothetical protein
MNGVDMRTFIEGDELVTGVGVLDCEHIAEYCGVDAKWMRSVIQITNKV